MLRLKNIKADEFKKRESVFIEIDGLLVPFFIEEFKTATSESAIVKFEGIDTGNRARIFTGNEVYVDANQIKKKKKSPDEFPDLKGYRVIDDKLGFVGIAGELEEITNNPLLRVMHEGKEYLIPVHEDIILEIDDQIREVRIIAPQGLFEL